MSELSTVPLVRSCRTVIESAGQVAERLRTGPGELQAQLAALDPTLGAAVRAMTDAVIELDYRTGYLDTAPLTIPQAL
jgi:hypothetical protein